MGNIVDTNGMDKFNRDLDNNIKRLERLNNTADKTAESFNRLSEAYNRLQNQASESIKFKLPKNNTNKSNSNTSKSTSNRNDNNSNNQNRSKNKTKDKYKNIKKSIRDFDNVYKITNDLGRSIKSANISGVATSASKALGLMSSGITAAVASTGIITAAIVLLSKVTLDAHKNTVAYARALQSMGIELSNFEKNNIETSNQMRDLGNRIDNVGQAIGEKLYPALGMILDIVDFITGGISSEESKKNIALAQSNISTSAQQSGFDLSSANNLAGNTYKIAQQIADTTSEQASDVATKLADAWLNGTDAAKEYGVVVNDQVLTGYMASQGIDIANVQITEAMKQYYRYQLMMEQLNASSSETMQDMIKEWTELGFIIDKTKGKLFSFDEVIQLTAADPNIPTVDGDGIYNPNESIGGDNNIPPIIKDPNSPNDNNIPIPNPEPVKVPIEWQIPALNLPVPSPVVVPVEVRNKGLIDSLQEALDKLPVNVPVNVPVTVPGIESIPTLEGLLGRLPVSRPMPITVTVPGIEYIPILESMLSVIPSVQPVAVPVTIPGMGLLPELYSQIKSVAKSWSSKVAVSVSGTSALKTVKSLLQNIVSLESKVKSVKLSNNNSSVVKDTPEVSTAKSMAEKNGLDWNSMAYSLQNQYKTVAKEINSNPILTVSDGAEMIKNYINTGVVSSSKVDWINTTGTDIANTASVVGAGAGVIGGGLILGPTAIAGAGSIGSKLPSFGSSFGSSSGLFSPGFADGGIGTKEIHNATLFEDNRKEAVIPLETEAGIRYLSKAMEQAQGLSGQSSGGDITVNLTLSGVNIADNDAQWEKVGKKIAEVIDIQRMRRGELNYGSSF